MTMTRIYWASLYLMLALYFLSTLALQEPFLHPEAVLQAHWWNEAGVSFWNVLFDSWKTDQHPGRFRYVVYLVEGTYWRLFKAGWIPSTFYDFFAIVCNCTIALLLFLSARAAKAKPLLTFAIVALFLLSTPVFMTSTWHCRKAKYIVTLWFALTLYLREKKTMSGTFSWPLVAVTIAGVFTDPYFILLYPLLILALDLQKGSWVGVRSLIAGYGLGFLGICLLNGVVGPLINQRTQLVFHHFEHIPVYYFNLRNLEMLPVLGLDFIGPLMLLRHPNLGWLFLFVSLGTAALVCWRIERKPYLFLAFLLSLPIAAFMVLPKLSTARFGTYYGHPVFFLFVVGILDLFLSLDRRLSKFSTYAPVALFAVIVLHQMGRYPLFFGWRTGAFGAKPVSLVRYNEDEILLNQLRQRRWDVATPFRIRLEGKDEYREEWGYTYPVPGAPNLPHHDLGYLLVPLLFEKQIQRGELIISP